MRKAMSPQELSLWLHLRELKTLGWRFRRQAPEPPYILDFVCRGAMLVVEVDGVHHAGIEQSTHDERRDAFLAERGFSVLRFWASDVESDIDAVMETILNALGPRDPTRRPSTSSGRHPPLEGEGKGRRYRRLVRLGLLRREE